MSGKYILVDGQPVAEPDLFAWARWCEANRAEKRVAYTQVAPGVEVYTVFLALDHNFSGDGSPVLWESMTFGGVENGAQCRYTSEADARAGHDAMVAKATESL